MPKKEVKEVTGEIDEITENSVKICNYWIKFFDMNKLKNFNLDDFVKVTYTDNVKDNKTYHNGETIEFVKKEVKENKIKDSIASQLLSYSKDIFIEELKRNGDVISLSDIVKDIIENYNNIRELI